jgi:PBP1b-binding outer membrane lipoprotein LpoB
MRNVILLVCILFAGCAGVASKVGQSKLQEITTADVDAAIEMAKAGNDQDGLACWMAIKAVMPATGVAQIDVKGAASALQAARNVRRSVQAGVDPVVHKNCAVVILDAEQTALKLGLRLH